MTVMVASALEAELAGLHSVRIEKHRTAHLLPRDSDDAALSVVDLEGELFNVFWHGSTMIVEHAASKVARAADIEPLLTACALDALREANEVRNAI